MKLALAKMFLAAAEVCTILLFGQNINELNLRSTISFDPLV